jgi:hypothetical protein
LEYRDTAGGNWISVSVTDNSYPLAPLTPSTVYAVRVRAICGMEDTSAYADTIFKTYSQPCDRPQKPTVESMTSSIVIINWEKGGDETRWQLEYMSATDIGWNIRNITSGTPSNHFENLIANMKHCVQVRAVCDDGQVSPPSDTLCFTTGQLPTRIIEASASAGGTITPEGITSVQVGHNSPEYTFSANPGYTIEALFIDDVPTIPIPESYTFTNVQDNHTIRVVFSTGIDNHQLQMTNYVIYPNPTTGILYITSVGANNSASLMNVPIELFDVMGRRLFLTPSFGQRGEVNISHLPSGVYFLRINGEMAKIIKQ